MKPKILAKNKAHLKQLIKAEIKKNGINCDLNHIDVSGMINMNELFYKLAFNGDISQWNVSRVKTMRSMFWKSIFNGDISKWDVSNVGVMGAMFASSEFNKDITQWDVSNVTDMNCIFDGSKFKGDVSSWKPVNLIRVEYAFSNCEAPMPYWAKFEDKEKRNIAIDNYWLHQELSKELDKNPNKDKKLKI